ncbi:argininosuccinate lyase [Bartonella chomelii]|uniref:Argininosuccinate lyase n=1 Tax=Bartonella chomelii TaxID=236402 RepID=A0ABR6E2Q6_9HYPH|nr:argininosuccinate lyase [Bartonella chomelii]
MAELQTIYPDVNTAVFDVLTVEKSVKSRKSFGRTAPLEVLRQIAYWKRYLVSV